MNSNKEYNLNIGSYDEIYNKWEIEEMNYNKYITHTKELEKYYIYLLIIYNYNVYQLYNLVIIFIKQIYNVWFIHRPLLGLIKIY